MAKSLEEQIALLNQEALEREFTSALIIKDQIQAVLDSALEPYKDKEKNRTLKDQMMHAVNKSLQGMLQADSHEALMLHEKRLRELVTNIREKFALQNSSAAALADYRFNHANLRLLHKINFKDREHIIKEIASLSHEHIDFPQWQKNFTELASQQSEADFSTLKERLVTQLMKQESEGNLANFASLSLVEESINSLNNTRLSYLEETNRKSRLLKDAAWILLGVGLVTAASVLAIAFPLLVIPGLVVGGVVAGYGAIDLAQQATELNSEIEQHKLLSRKMSTENGNEFRMNMAVKLGIQDVDDFLKQQQSKHEGMSREKKLFRGLAIGSSFSALALGVAALALTIPVLGAPVAAVIAIAVASIALVSFIAGLVGFKQFREEKKLKESKSWVAQQIAEDKKIIDSMQLELSSKPELSSMAKIEKATGVKEMQQTNQNLLEEEDFDAPAFIKKRPQVKIETSLNKQKLSEIKRVRLDGNQSMNAEETDHEDEGEGEHPEV